MQRILTNRLFVNLDFVSEHGSPSGTVNPVISYSDEIKGSKNNRTFPRSFAYHTRWACVRCTKIKFKFSFAMWAQEQKLWKFTKNQVNSGTDCFVSEMNWCPKFRWACATMAPSRLRLLSRLSYLFQALFKRSSVSALNMNCSREGFLVNIWAISVFCRNV